MPTKHSIVTCCFSSFDDTKSNWRIYCILGQIHSEILTSAEVCRTNVRVLMKGHIASPEIGKCKHNIWVVIQFYPSWSKYSVFYSVIFRHWLDLTCSSNIIRSVSSFSMYHVARQIIRPGYKACNIVILTFLQKVILRKRYFNIVVCWQIVTEAILARILLD